MRGAYLKQARKVLDILLHFFYLLILFFEINSVRLLIRDIYRIANNGVYVDPKNPVDIINPYALNWYYTSEEMLILSMMLILFILLPSLITFVYFCFNRKWQRACFMLIFPILCIFIGEQVSNYINFVMLLLR